MSISDLTTTQIVAIAVGVLIVVGIVAYLATRNRRSARLREQFGPEYERAVAEGGDRKLAEAKLAERAERVRSFHLRPLAPADRANFVEAWKRVQAHFVDEPSAAVREADQLLGQVMSTRGYPVSDFEQRAADISVDHPVVVQNYRNAHSIALRHASGQAGTEDLRKAMIYYRDLFEELVSDPKGPAKADIDRDGTAAGATSRGAVA